MLYVFTSKIGKYKGRNGIDITVKGNHPIGHIFAPTWDMVMGFKNGRLTISDYTAMYSEILKLIPTGGARELQQILNMDFVVLECYCGQYSFCHRNLAALWLAENYGAKYNGYIER